MNQMTQSSITVYIAVVGSMSDLSCVLLHSAGMEYFSPCAIAVVAFQYVDCCSDVAFVAYCSYMDTEIYV